MPRRTDISSILIIDADFPSPRRGEDRARSASGEGVRPHRERGSPSPQPSPRWGEGVKLRPWWALSMILTSLSACATAQMHSQEELNNASLSCGLTYGELIQDDEQKKLLILFREKPSAAQRACVYQWAAKRHLKLVVVDAITFPEE